MDPRTSLLNRICTSSYREGDFTLSSGAKSNFYIDLKPTILHPEGAYAFGECALDWMQKNRLSFEGVGGLTLGADPLVMAISLAARSRGITLPASMIRKEPKKHGTSRFIEGVENFKPGARFLVVEDVVTTGASALKAVEILKDAGFQPTKILSIVDRDAGGSAAFKKIGLDLHSLFSIAELSSHYRNHSNHSLTN
jgi:orotate phosphoribosyltransferase